MLQWSFVRNDQPRDRTCHQLALAIQDEVRDLERSGIKVRFAFLIMLGSDITDCHTHPHDRSFKLTNPLCERDSR